MKKRILVACLIALFLALLSCANEYKKQETIKCVENGGNPRECEQQVGR